MNDFLQQLVSMGPGIGAAVGGNGTAFAAFMEGYQRTLQAIQQQKRMQQQDQLALQDRELALEDRQRAIGRQEEADQFTRQARTQQQALQGMQIPGHLAEMGAAGDTPEDAQAIIEAAMPNLMKAFGQESMAYGQPAVEMAQRTITGRQKAEVKAYIKDVIESPHVSPDPNSDPRDPEVQLTPRMQKITGKPSMRLTELQAFADMAPIGKPAAKKSLANPTEASLAYEAAGGDASKAFGMLNAPKPSTTDPEITALRKELLQAQVDKAKEGANKGTGQPSAYSVERASRTIASVDALMAKVNRWTTGIGSMLSGIPETDARNFRAELDTLKANIAFNELTAMREASKTGGALGAVSDREMNLLQSALGALDAGQSPENIKAQLQKIKESVQRWQTAHGMPAAVSHAPTTVAPKKNPFRP